MFGINRNLPPVSGPTQAGRPAPVGREQPIPDPSEQVELSSSSTSPSSRLGKVLLGAGCLGFMGLVGGVLAGAMASPAVFVVGTVASLLSVASGGIMASRGSSQPTGSSGSLETHLSQDGQISNTLRVGEPAGPGQVQQNLDLATGQLHQQINVGSGYYLDPSTGRLVYHM